MTQPEHDAQYETYDDHAAEQHGMFFEMPTHETEAERRRRTLPWTTPVYGSADY